MARYSFRLPDIGEGIAEAEIVAWHVKIGDRIEEDAQLADMMTDKATVEMESPVSGVIVELAGERFERRPDVLAGVIRGQDDGDEGCAHRTPGDGRCPGMVPGGRCRMGTRR